MYYWREIITKGKPDYVAVIDCGDSDEGKPLELILNDEDLRILNERKIDPDDGVIIARRSRQ